MSERHKSRPYPLILYCQEFACSGVHSEHNGCSIRSTRKKPDRSLFLRFVSILLFCSGCNFAEYCKCPKTIHANWYSIPPYIRDKGSYKPGGLFPLLLEKIVARCCGNCTGGDGESEISYVNRRDNLVTKARDKICHCLRFSNDCRKMATKVITAMNKKSKQHD